MDRVLYQCSNKYRTMSWGTNRFMFDITMTNRDSLVLNDVDKGLMFVTM